MANRERGEWTITAGDVAYVLRLTTTGCVEVEDLSQGRSWEQIVAGFYTQRLVDIRLVLWAALRDRSEAFDLDAAGVVFDRMGGLHGGGYEQLCSFLAWNAAPVTVGPRKAEPKGPATSWRDLYVDALLAGLTSEQFWGLSLRELWVVQEAARRRQSAEQDRLITTAWYVAAFSRQNKLPALSTVLQRQSGPQSVGQMKAALAMLSEQYGIPLRQKES